MRNNTQTRSAVKKKQSEISQPVLFENSPSTIPSAPNIPVEPRKQTVAPVDGPYLGVPSGPYRCHYEAWLKTPEGQRIARDRSRVRYKGYIDFMLDLVTVGVTRENFDKFIREDHE